MRPIEIRGELHDLDDLARRGRALQGEAMCAWFAAWYRLAARRLAALRSWRRDRARLAYSRCKGGQARA